MASDNFNIGKQGLKQHAGSSKQEEKKRDLSGDCDHTFNKANFSDASNLVFFSFPRDVK